jgi:hypothetical protein
LFSAHIEPDENTRPRSSARSRPGCPSGIRVGMGMPTYGIDGIVVGSNPLRPRVCGWNLRFRAPFGHPCRQRVANLRRGAGPETGRRPAGRPRCVAGHHRASETPSTLPESPGTRDRTDWLAGSGCSRFISSPTRTPDPRCAARSRPGCPSGIRVGMGMPTYGSGGIVVGSNPLRPRVCGRNLRFRRWEGPGRGRRMAEMLRRPGDHGIR